MGGHAAGREAAELALSIIFEVFGAAPEGSAPAHVLRSAIEEASRRVYRMTTSEVAMGRPGSTVVAVLLHEAGTDVAHVGDSRAFLVHEGQIYRLTRDHSIVEELVRRGIITAEQAAHHPDANRITRALGISPEVEAELRPTPVVHVSGDVFVLCSDGLSDLVEEPEILAIVAGEPPAQAVGRLVDLANARGGYDNITVAVLRARQGALASTAPLAPTVAQTAVTTTQAPDTVPTPSLEPPPSPRATVPAFPSPHVALVPPHPDRGMTRGARRARRRANPVVVVAIALAAVAVALLAAVMAAHLDDRRGKSGTPSSGSASSPGER